MTAEDKIELLQRCLKGILPKCNFSPFIYSNDDVINDIYFALNNDNSQFRKSKYTFDSKNNIVHFTTFRSLESILQSATIRLYNLKKMDDPIEFQYAAKFFNVDTKKIDKSKSNIFCLSFCEESLLFKHRKIDQFNQWRLYGENGFGAAIVFDINNDPFKWCDFHMSKVHYGNSNSDKVSGFGKLNKILIKLNEDTPTIDFDFGKLLCFHKSAIYSVEEEIRLIFDGRDKKPGIGFTKITKNDKLLSPIIETEDVNKDIKFLNLKLYTDNDDNISDMIPLLKITKIIIGYQYDTKEYLKIKKEIENICKNYLGYIPIIQRTKLYSHFWGLR